MKWKKKRGGKYWKIQVIGIYQENYTCINIVRF